MSILHATARTLPLLLAASTLLAGTLLAGAGQAATLRRSHAPVELHLVDSGDGAPLAQYPHRGARWVAGDPGQTYAVRLRNTGGQRLLVVLSVDGINAIDGRTAGYAQAGYVLEPWQSLDVEGWRKSMDAVARFEFIDPAYSYAARTGRPDNVGVVGIAVFRERADVRAERYRSPAPIAAQDDAAGAPGTTAKASPRSRAAAEGMADLEQAEPVQRLGTGHGQRQSAPARHTSFRREPSPIQVSELRYDTAAGLVARGIRIAPYHPHARPASPRAFPAGFVPDPPR